MPAMYISMYAPEQQTTHVLLNICYSSKVKYSQAEKTEGQCVQSRESITRLKTDVQSCVGMLTITMLLTIQLAITQQYVTVLLATTLQSFSPPSI